jgi:hypothetical protein
MRRAMISTRLKKEGFARFFVRTYRRFVFCGNFKCYFCAFLYRYFASGAFVIRWENGLGGYERIFSLVRVFGIREKIKKKSVSIRPIRPIRSPIVSQPFKNQKLFKYATSTIKKSERWRKN